MSGAQRENALGRPLVDHWGVVQFTHWMLGTVWTRSETWSVSGVFLLSPNRQLEHTQLALWRSQESQCVHFVLFWNECLVSNVPCVCV